MIDDKEKKEAMERLMKELQEGRASGEKEGYIPAEEVLKIIRNK